MDRGDMPSFLACLVKLAKAQGENLDQERMQIYFEDLAEFSMQQVMGSMTWARQNLSRFPKIAELRSYIEGDPEDLWQRAWAALHTLVRKSPRPTITIDDRVMAKAMQDLWGGWAGTVHVFEHTEGDFALAALRKSFQVSYLANWKHRHELPSPVTFPGWMPDKCELPATISHYRVVDYEVELVEQRRLEQPKREVEPMTPEIRARLDAMLSGIGRTPESYLRAKGCTCYEGYCGRPCTCGKPQGRIYRHHVSDASNPAVPGGENSPAGDLT